MAILEDCFRFYLFITSFVIFRDFSLDLFHFLNHWWYFANDIGKTIVVINDKQ